MLFRSPWSDAVVCRHVSRYKMHVVGDDSGVTVRLWLWLMVQRVGELSHGQSSCWVLVVVESVYCLRESSMVHCHPALYHSPGCGNEVTAKISIY